MFLFFGSSLYSGKIALCYQEIPHFAIPIDPLNSESKALNHNPFSIQIEKRNTIFFSFLKVNTEVITPSKRLIFFLSTWNKV